MPKEQLVILTRLLRVARRNLADDAPHSPAWAATTEWVDALEGEIHDLAVELGLAAAIPLAATGRLA